MYQDNGTADKIHFVRVKDPDAKTYEETIPSPSVSSSFLFDIKAEAKQAMPTCALESQWHTGLFIFTYAETAATVS